MHLEREENPDTVCKKTKRKKDEEYLIARLHPRLRSNHLRYYVLILSHDCMHARLLHLLRKTALVSHKGDKLLHTYVLLKYTFSILYTNSMYLSSMPSLIPKIRYIIGEYCPRFAI
jgi:hypothetical protein